MLIQKMDEQEQQLVQRAEEERRRLTTYIQQLQREKDEQEKKHGKRSALWQNLNLFLSTVSIIVGLLPI